MSIIEKIAAPTPAKYKVWGKTFKWMAASLVAGMLGVNTAGLVLPTNFNTYIASAVFITSAASAAFYSQVENNTKENA